MKEFDETNERDRKIIILAAGKALISIKSCLEESGRNEFLDFTDMDTFFEEYFWRFRRKVHIGKITTSVTTKCNFNCKNCNMLMPYYQNPQEYSYDMLCKDADLLFSLVDYVSAFVIIGGEPFLYHDLNPYLLYLAETYGSAGNRRIGNIQLITNGSVRPSAALLDIIFKYNIEVRISDYTHIIPYQDKLQELITMLNEANIRYVVFEQNEWIDFGFPHDKVNMGESKEELRLHMLKCHGMCHWLHNGRYYYCSNAWSAQECGLFQLNSKNDFLKLEDLLSKGEEGKRQLLDFYKGNLSDGYMSFCKVCIGFESTKTVEAGLQMPRC